MRLLSLLAQLPSYLHLPLHPSSPISNYLLGLLLASLLLLDTITLDARGQGPFLLSIDHCFAIKGQGTVMTGTVMRVSQLKGWEEGRTGLLIPVC